MPHNPNQSSKSSSGPFHARNFSLLLCLGALAGVLIWAKLRLVTDIPRSAYADPREVMVPEQALDDATDHERDLADPSSDEPWQDDEHDDGHDDEQDADDQMDSLHDLNPHFRKNSTGEGEDRTQTQPS